MANEINLPKDKDLANKILDNHNTITAKELEQGILGKFWGGSSSVPNNIAALLILVLLLTAIIYSLCMMNVAQDKIALPIKDFWAIVVPLITLAVGYLFGDKPNRNGS